MRRNHLPLVRFSTDEEVAGEGVYPQQLPTPLVRETDVDSPRRQLPVEARPHPSRIPRQPGPPDTMVHTRAPSDIVSEGSSKKRFIIKLAKRNQAVEEGSVRAPLRTLSPEARHEQPAMLPQGEIQVDRASARPLLNRNKLPRDNE
ncbi:hypothetical protein DCAR_0728778 [Daucus carota subsp. sativus]|uniref:Uncharacterized protein n=1 Tax=Daucus carota subsp. sativus TaxID=79200 RepID=A0A161ZNR6_DAUCS|nr:hypothetical protein DCAR_0728778 [Daucus carota subsp. sativus]